MKNEKIIKLKLFNLIEYHQLNIFFILFNLTFRFVIFYYFVIIF